MRYPLEFVAEGLSRFVGCLPRPFLASACRGIGTLAHALLPGRRRIVRQNLRRVLPHTDEASIRATTREHFLHLAEYGLLVLLLPRLRPDERARLCQLDEKTRQQFLDYDAAGKGLIVMIPHFSLNEALTLGPRDLGLRAPVAGVFRPLDSKGLNRWITRSRAVGGVELIDRTGGIRRAGSLLRHHGGFISVFFDQHTGMAGQLNLFADSLVSSTPLSDLLQRQTGAPGVYLTLRRTGFLRGTVDSTPLDPHRSYLDQAEDLLAAQLRRAETDTAGWLWSHRRWKIRNAPHRLLGYRNKKIHPNLLAPDGHLRPDLPRTFPLLIRLPNWLGDAVILIPLLRTFRTARPDAHITLLGPAFLEPLFTTLLPESFDAYRILPERRPGYRRALRPSLDPEYEAALLFTNSWRGDLEVRALGIPLRGGIRRPGRPRPFLTHTWKAPGWEKEKRMHQLDFWSEYLRRFGWRESPDRSPLTWDAGDGPTKRSQTVVCFPGSTNDPEKRWPVRHWAELISGLLAARPDLTVTLAGTPQDRLTTEQIKASVSDPRLHDGAGQTDLPALITTLRAATLVIGIDSGGIHLANALGIPVIALFGPTNPTRTGPVFNAPVEILQPPGASPLGGSNIDQLHSSEVLDETLKMLKP